jgi:hypothetical protein
MTSLNNSVALWFDNQENKNMLFLVINFIIVFIFIFCLKKFNPILLALLLTILLGGIIGNSNTNLMYFLPIAGLVLYIIKITVDQQEKYLSLTDKIKNTIWNVPFYGIMAFYIIHIYEKLK